MKQWYLHRAFEKLENITPLRYDCGTICNAKCCKGSTNDGMLLFPGEEQFFQDKDGFIIKDSPYGKAVICNGSCHRNERPLSCRIFPLFPYVIKVEDHYKITVLKDVRALQYCPLDENDIDPKFYRAVRLATRSLLRDEEYAAFLLRLTQEFTDIGSF